jgi:YD repeat-containing protein
MTKLSQAVKKLLIGALTMAGCAVAEAGDSYDASGRFIGRYNEATSTYSGIDGSVRKSVVVRGNCAARSCTVRTYDANGRFTGTGIRRGNVLYSYDSNGHRIARVVYNSSNNAFTAYNNRGRYVGSGSR